jgi:predicted MFS family arabinose efflux permease
MNTTVAAGFHSTSPYRDVFLLSLGAALAPGLVRLSYALLLPPMKADLGWTFTQAGSLNTANAAGYLAGAIATMWLGKKFRSTTLFMVGCYLCAALLAVAGGITDIGAMRAQRFMSGFANALAFIAGGTLIARVALTRQRPGLVLGIYYAGVGWGVMIASLLVPLTLGHDGHGWQASWFALAAVAVLLTLGATWAASHTADEGTQSVAWERGPAIAQYLRMLLAYGLYGVGYIAYLTFIVALLRRGGMSGYGAAELFGVLGLAAALSPFVWPALIEKSGGGKALAALNMVLAIATIIPALSHGRTGQFASCLIFGSAFMGAVTSTTNFVRRNLPTGQWHASISAFTIAFALGQGVGPFLIGYVADHFSLETSFLLAGAVLFMGSMFAAAQPQLHKIS